MVFQRDPGSQPRDYAPEQHGDTHRKGANDYVPHYLSEDEELGPPTAAGDLAIAALVDGRLQWQRAATGASGTVFIGGSTFSADLLITGYGRIGSTTAPTNTTPGDLTVVRLLAGNATLAAGVVGAFAGNVTATGWQRIGSASAPANTTAGDLTAVRLFVNNDSNYSLAVVSSKPTITVDSNDYYEYDRTNNRHSFFVGSTEMLRANATAIENKSYSVRATNAAGSLAVAVATVVAVTFATEDYDTGAMHDTGSNTSRLTAPVTGRYAVTGGVLWAAEALSTVTFLLCRISKNGTAIPGARSYYPPISSIATNGLAQVVACEIALAATEYVEMEVFFDAGAAGRNLTLSGCALSMHYIGGL